MTLYERVLYHRCPMCGSEEFVDAGTYSVIEHPLWTPEFDREIDWVQCMNCDHIFTNGYFNPDALDHLTLQVPPGQSAGEDAENARMLASRTVEWIDRLSCRWHTKRFGDAKWLDIGIGSGALLVTANELGYDTTGVDIREDTCVEFMEYGAIRTRFEDFYSESRFDVISMADVLEHIPFPLAVLEKAAGLLKSNGLLFIATPNYDCYAWGCSSEPNPYWRELEHFHTFRIEQLVDVLERQVGLQVIAMRASVNYRFGIEIVARAGAH